MREGDLFKKFGGGTKNLGSYFSDLKIPARLRRQIPLIAKENKVYVVCGVEISEEVKTSAGGDCAFCACCDFTDLNL